jgi:hypothetical protein
MGRHLQPTTFQRRPDTHDPSGLLVAWFTQPAGAIIQLVQEAELTAAMGAWLADRGCQELLTRFPGPTTLTIILDLRLMTSRQTAVRGLLVETAKKIAPRLEMGFVIPPAGSGKVYLASLHAATAALRAFGAKVSVAESLSQLCQERGIRPV